MIRLVPFELEHLVDIDPPLLTAEQCKILKPFFRQRGPAYSGIANDKVLGCAGVIVEGNVGFAWLALSDRIRQRPMMLHRAVKRGLEQVEEKLSLQRLEAQVHCEFEQGRRWVERLGFKLAGDLPNFAGSGETYLRFVK